MKHLLISYLAGPLQMNLATLKLPQIRKLYIFNAMILPKIPSYRLVDRCRCENVQFTHSIALLHCYCCLYVDI